MKHTCTVHLAKIIWISEWLQSIYCYNVFFPSLHFFFYIRSEIHLPTYLRSVYCWKLNLSSTPSCANDIMPAYNISIRFYLFDLHTKEKHFHALLHRLFPSGEFLYSSSPSRLTLTIFIAIISIFLYILCVYVDYLTAFSC